MILSIILLFYRLYNQFIYATNELSVNFNLFCLPVYGALLHFISEVHDQGLERKEYRLFRLSGH